MEKYRIDLPILVEGRYDKNTLSQIFEATVIVLDGFGIFNSREKQALVRKIAHDGIIILTDSDAGGRQIRSFLSGILPKEKIHNVYIPQVKGKERRKTSPSKQGLLGVEGMDRETLIRILSPFIVEDSSGLSEKKPKRKITKTDFFLDGLSGSDNASERRAALAVYFDLPQDMTANALCEALNIITDYDGYKSAVRTLFE